MVFDCARRFQGDSLNDRVLQGPDLVNKLINVLVRFRQHSFAIQADVEAMYNQVRVPKSDRDALRFLWMNDNEVVHYRMTSHLFGGKWCASSSAYTLRRTAQDSASIDPSVREAIERNFYVDDLLHSCASSEDARLIIHETPEVLHEGGFNLTKFEVKDDKLLDEISVEHRAKKLIGLIGHLMFKVKCSVLNGTFVQIRSFFRSRKLTPNRSAEERYLALSLPFLTRWALLVL